MSLINLSRSSPQAKTNQAKRVSADEFIHDALSYANGGIIPLSQSTKSQDETVHPVPMRRATFTLTEECIELLQELSTQSGIAKSKLIRLWIKRYASINDA